MTWYHCREVIVAFILLLEICLIFILFKVTRRFRAKLNSRLTAVSFFMFLIPLTSLLELGVCTRGRQMSPTSRACDNSFHSLACSTGILLRPQR